MNRVLHALYVKHIAIIVIVSSSDPYHIIASVCCYVSLTYRARSFHFPPVSARRQVIISSAIVAGRRSRGRTSAARPAKPPASTPWPAAVMTTESGRQRDAGVARRKLNRDYRLVSCSPIIRPSVPPVRHRGPRGLSTGTSMMQNIRVAVANMPTTTVAGCAAPMTNRRYLRPAICR